MRHVISIVLVACAVVPFTSAADAPQAASENSAEQALLQLPGARQELVFEPVFQGEALIYLAGPEDAPAVVLVHGMGSNGLRDFAPLIPALARSYRVLTFDLPGFGRSTHANVLYSPLNYASFVRWAADRYLGRPHAVLGHSMGAAVALRYAATFPAQVRTLILADSAGILQEVALGTEMLETQVPKLLPSAAPDPPTDLMRMLSNRLAGHMQKLPIDLELALGGEKVRGLMLRGNPSAIVSLALVQEDYSRLVEQVRMPTLILWGANDSVVPLRTAKVLACRLPQARLEMIPDAGHVPMKDQPRAFNSRVLAALGSPPRATPKQGPPAGFVSSTRVAHCNGENDVVFVGPYARIEVEGCSRVRLLDVYAKELVIRSSQVEIEGGAIAGGEVGVEIENGLLMATAARIAGDTAAIRAENSRLDLAAVDLAGGESTVATESTATVVASLCRIERAGGFEHLHGLVKIGPDTPL